MTTNQPIRLFIAHNFTKHDDFLKTIEYIESRDSFMYVNTSNPEAKTEGAEAAQEELRKQIGLAEVFLIPVNFYTDNKADVDYQMRIAQNFDIPVLGIQAFGATMEIPKALLDACADIVEWEPRRIVTAMKRLARNEQIGEYEVVEFTLE